mmetsp:Transcript_14042/g.20505  ORF Transcript_14042/g.20505 Transcript_14042/m.20505 type:complete len:515 (+) Transcript_14042:197-1741(+)|eukprot:CAMPEP_0195520042 /NCGR_PEP_ID=MMETSP0794_2-20130614/15975_1 /TAXON_ID=515487 /ORGANISM="Stephanopyxis turris, Strain CCMP 815" /LENGTH=514 /DNA_ID=CAMNT_0040649311 /DNA_START=187 /DNA_END=1731 /DNA_ORIENTATION=-
MASLPSWIDPNLSEKLMVNNPIDTTTNATNATPLNHQSAYLTRGEKQAPQYRDAPFAILFVIHLILTIMTCMTLGGPALSAAKTPSTSGNVDSSPDHALGLFYLPLLMGVCSLIFSTITLHLLMRFSAALIQLSLFASVSASFFVGVVGIYAGSTIGAVFGFGMTAIGLCYAKYIWNYIPFASANLNTACRAIRENTTGLHCVVYLLSGVGFLYGLLWSSALLGVYYKSEECVDSVCTYHPNGLWVLLLVFGYFWTQQVIQNTIHVSVAGTVGTWWFEPSDCISSSSPHCTFISDAVKDSFIRAITHSFGSICLGSLLVAILQTLRALLEQIKQQALRNGNNNNNYGAMLICIADCVLAQIEGLLEYFHKWSYVYVGLYGYTYVSSGKRVMELFQSKGWTTIINFDLVSGALMVVNVGVGLICGLFGLLVLTIVRKGTDWFDMWGDNPEGMVFFVAFLIGIILASIMTSLISSAVNTVIVCFAEGPGEFQANHPELSEEMRVAWRAAYPEECGF